MVNFSLSLGLAVWYCFSLLPNYVLLKIAVLCTAPFCPAFLKPFFSPSSPLVNLLALQSWLFMNSEPCVFIGKVHAHMHVIWVDLFSGLFKKSEKGPGIHCLLIYLISRHSGNSGYYCVTSVCRDVKYVYIAVCLMVHSSQWLFVCKTWILPCYMPSCNFEAKWQH